MSFKLAMERKSGRERVSRFELVSVCSVEVEEVKRRNIDAPPAEMEVIFDNVTAETLADIERKVQAGVFQ